MRIRILLLVLLAALLAGCGGTAATGGSGASVTVYSADAGLTALPVESWRRLAPVLT